MDREIDGAQSATDSDGHGHDDSAAGSDIGGENGAAAPITVAQVTTDNPAVAGTPQQTSNPPVEDAKVEATFVSTEGAKIVLPTGADVDSIMVRGDDLLLIQADGSVIVIVDGAKFPPDLVIGGIEVPAETLAQIISNAEPGVPTAGAELPESDGLNVPAEDAPVTATFTSSDGAKIVLPAGTSVDTIMVRGDNLILVQEDGSIIVILDGAKYPPTLLLGGIEIPSDSLAFIIKDAPEGVPTAGPSTTQATGDAGPQQVPSSGGEFAEVNPHLGDPFPIGPLLPPTALQFFVPIVKEDEPGFLEDDGGVGAAAPPVPPSIGENLGLLVDEDDIVGKGGNAGGPGDKDGPPDAIVSGLLHYSFGSGPAAVDPFVIDVGSLNALGLTSNGAPVQFAWDGTTLTGFVDNDGTPGFSPGDLKVLVLEIPNPTVAGNDHPFTLTLLEPLDHAHDSGDGTAFENDIVLQINFTVTTNAGLTTSGSFPLTINDDSPELNVGAGEGTVANLALNLDETIGADRYSSADGPHDDNGATDDTAQTVIDGVNAIGRSETAANAVQNLFSVALAPGADGQQSVVYNFGFVLSGNGASNLTATQPAPGGNPGSTPYADPAIYFFQIDAHTIEGHVGDANGPLALRITLSDPDNTVLGDETIVVEQFLAIDHGPDGNAFDTELALHLTDGSLGLNLTTTLTDGDNDFATDGHTVTLVDGEVSFVAIDDDGPAAPSVGDGEGSLANLALNLDETIDPDHNQTPGDHKDTYNSATSETESNGVTANGDDDDTGQPAVNGSDPIGRLTTSANAVSSLFSVAAFDPGNDGQKSVDYGFAFTLSSDLVATTLKVTPAAPGGNPVADYGDGVIYLVQVDDHHIEGHVGAADGPLALTITFNDPDPSVLGGETITVEQYLAIDHGADQNAFDTELPLNLAEGESLGLNLTVTLTDGDNDAAATTHSVTLIDDDATFVSFDDDGPSASVTVEASPDELAALQLNLDETHGTDRYNGAEPQDNNGEADDTSVLAPAPTTVLGSAQAIGELSTHLAGGLGTLFSTPVVTTGTDGGTSSSALSLVLTGAGDAATVQTNLVATALVGTGLENLSVADRTVWLTEEGGEIVGRVGHDTLDTSDDYIVFKISLSSTDPATAQLIVDQYLPIDHDASDSTDPAIESPSVFDEQVSLLSALEGQGVGLKMTVTVTDGDTDTAIGSATVDLITDDSSFVHFDDDGPQVVAQSICAPGPTGEDFPTWPQDISNVVLYFDQDTGDTKPGSGDGYYLVKIDNVPSVAPDDLDAWIQAVRDWLIANDPNVTAESDLLGAAIKGGTQTTQFYSYGTHNLNGETADPFPVGAPVAETPPPQGNVPGPSIDATYNFSQLFPEGIPATGESGDCDPILVHDETQGVQSGTGGTNTNDQNDAAGNTLPGTILALFNAVTVKGVDPDVSLDNNAIGFARSGAGNSGVTYTVDYGTDGQHQTSPIVYALGIPGGEAANGAVDSGLLTTDGHKIYLFQQPDGLIVGRVDSDGTPGAVATDPAAFALTIDPATGELFVAQYLSLQHPDAGNGTNGTYDEQVTIIDGAVRVTVTAFDGDNDHVTSNAVGIGHLIAFQDDGPSVTVIADATGDELAALFKNLDELVQPDGAFNPDYDRYNGAETESGGGGINGGDDDVASAPNNYNQTPTVSAAPTAGQAIGHVITGAGILDDLFGFGTPNFGSDGPATSNSRVDALSFQLSGASSQTTLAVTALDNTSLETLTLLQRTIYLVKVSDTVIEGRVPGADGVGANDAVAFRLTLNDAGSPGTASITIDQFLPIDHGGTENPSLYDEQALLNMVGDGALALRLTSTVTDGDGDTATSSADVKLVTNETSILAFDDDGPTANPQINATILDDEDQTPHALPGSPGIQGGLGDDGSGKSLSGSVHIDYGTDGPATAVNPLVLAQSVVVKDETGATIGQPGVVYVDASGNGVSELITSYSFVADPAGGGTLYAFSTHYATTANYVFKVDINAAGDYTFTANAPLSHPLHDDPNTEGVQTAYEDNLKLEFSYTATDGDGDHVGGTITVNMDDDIPNAVGETATAQEGKLATVNAVLVIDLSLSMGTASPDPIPPGGNGIDTRLQLLQAAVQNFLSNSDVTFNQVTVYTFGIGAQFVGQFTIGDPNYLQNAINAVNAFGQANLQSGTQYNAAANLIDGAGPTGYAQLAHPTSTETDLYFLSDGDPQSGASLNAAQQLAWTNFLNGYVDHVYAVGFGGVVNTTFLDQMAPRGSDIAFPVLNPAELEAVLQGSIPGNPSGNVLDNDGFGADGGHIHSVTIEGTTYTYDPVGHTISVTGVNPGADLLSNTGTQITVLTEIGGRIIFNFADNGLNHAGDWDYLAPSSGIDDEASQENFTYVLVDGDGDGATASLIINVLPSPVPIAADVLATVDDEGLPGGILGNGQSSGDIDVNPDPEHIASGSLAPNFQGDAPAASDPIKFLTVGNTGVVGTETVTYSWNGTTNTLTATSARGDIFKVVVDSGNDTGVGNYVFTLLKPILHAPGDGENDATVVLNYQLTDVNGDADTGTLTVTIDDDTPTLALSLKDGVTLVVDETDGPSDLAPGESDPAVGGNLGTVTVTAANLLNETAAFGADGQAAVNPKVYALGISSDGVASGFTDSQTDQAIVLHVGAGGMIEGHVGTTAGALSFTVSINATTGAVTLTQFRAIEHSDTASHDELSPGMTAGVLTLTETITDADADPISQSVDLGSVIKFADDGPAIDVVAGPEQGVLLTTHDALTIGPDTDTAVSTANFGGVFSIATSSFGSDGAGTAPVLSYALSLVGAPGTDSLPRQPRRKHLPVQHRRRHYGLDRCGYRRRGPGQHDLLDCRGR